jgi:NADH:ubiquinone oxidoreductase subunit 6 (subunit J)
MELLSGFFSLGALLSAFLVISVTNPIHSVFFLILVFCNAAGLLFLMQVDFLAMTFLVVYVGAIAVLFLFVVMMLNLNLATLHENLLRYLPIGTIIGVGFLVQSFLIVDQLPALQEVEPVFTNWSQLLQQSSTIELFGQVLYTHYFTYFLIASMILFVAMLGAIVLTAHPSHAVKRQDINLQLARSINL